MKSFFEGIQYLFVNILFAPLDFLRSLELESWFAANTINWFHDYLCSSNGIYWQLKFSMMLEQKQDTTAHSFLNKTT
jgi:hypothetical protein